MKNSGGQLASYLRTVYFGPFWADSTGLRQNGLPPMTYSRVNAMSDKHQAILMNPYFLVDSVVS